MPCDDARRPREGRARLHSQFHLVAQSRGPPFTFARICAPTPWCAHVFPPRHPRPHHDTIPHHTTPRKPYRNHTLEIQHTPTRAPPGKHNVIPPGIERHHPTPRKPDHDASSRKCSKVRPPHCPCIHHNTNTTQHNTTQQNTTRHATPRHATPHSTACTLLRTTSRHTPHHTPRYSLACHSSFRGHGIS